MMIFLVVSSYFVVFSLGFIVSHMSKQQGVAMISQQQTLPQHVEKQTDIYVATKTMNQQPKQEKFNRKIEIDDRKFITEVKTDSLEKKFDGLGKTTVAMDESLSANVSKLASLKKSKEG